MWACVVEGRPLWRRPRRRRGLLLPAAGSREAATEYASVAAFAELGLQLMAVGAPARLVVACHRAALDEVCHARIVESLDGRDGAEFGAMPALLGRRVGGSRRRRRTVVRRLAVESYLDGWCNESRAAEALRERAARSATTHERDALLSMARDEERHAALARDIVEWCFSEDPGGVALAIADRAGRPAAGRR